MILIDIEKVINDPFVFAIGKEEIEKYTVKAIPIEWIKKWYKNALSRSGFMGDEMISIADMLEQWEKENGTKESVRNI